MDYFPYGSELILTASGNECEKEFIDVPYTQSDFCYRISLNEKVQRKFILQQFEKSFFDYFYKVQIKNEGATLFIGHDGMSYGTLSKMIRLSEDFKRKYCHDGTCMISEEW